MKKYVIFNYKTGLLMDWDFNPVKDFKEAEIYDDLDYAREEIESRGEPFCKVVEVVEVEKELREFAEKKKENEFIQKNGGVGLHKLKYGQRFEVLNTALKGKIFTHQPQESHPKDDSIYLYEFENYSGAKVRITGNLAAILLVKILD